MSISSRSTMLLKRWWRLLVIILMPLVLLPLPLIIKTIQARCAYIVILLTVYEVSEVMPYAVASLLPLAFFPMAGILPADRVCLSYFRDITTLFVGSMILAHAMEHVRLHHRLALLVLSFVGSSVKWSMAGLMGVTAFLSMWINNSGATSIMIPAAIATIDVLQKHEQEVQDKAQRQADENRRKSKEIIPVASTIASDIKTAVEQQPIKLSINEENFSIDSIEQSNTIEQQKSTTINLNTTSTNSVDYGKLKTGFLLAVAYSSAIGGLATLVGTGPNIFVKGFTDQYYKTGPLIFEITFINFLLYALPTGLIMFITCWLWLQLLYNRRELLPWIKKDLKALESQKQLQSFLKEQYRELGSLSWREGVISILFVVMVGLWMTRDFSSRPGWAIIFQQKYVTDGTVALLIGVLPLIIPDKNPFSEKGEYKPILPWDHLSKTFPWGVFMLQGGGLAIADGFSAADLSSTIAHFLQFLDGASHVTIIMVVILLSALFTEFTSNLGCATILFPVLNSIAHTARIHPARLILPSCLSVSLSFMLPMATPPNAMIFSTDNVRIIDMIKAGLGMKIIGMLIIFLTSIVLITPVFHLHPMATSLLNSTLLTNSSHTI